MPHINDSAVTSDIISRHTSNISVSKHTGESGVLCDAN